MLAAGAVAVAAGSGNFKVGLAIQACHHHHITAAGNTPWLGRPGDCRAAVQSHVGAEARRDGFQSLEKEFMARSPSAVQRHPVTPGSIHIYLSEDFSDLNITSSCVDIFVT